MRVAFVGKGGAGKSTIAGTLARLLAQSGERVLALDSDPMPGLAFSIGVERIDAGMPDDAVHQYEFAGRGKYRLSEGLSGLDAIELYSVVGPDGVRFLQLGKARGPRWNNDRQHAAYQAVLDDLPRSDWNVIGDLPGGTRQPFFTWGRFAQIYLVVVEPTPASMLTGRRLARLSGLPHGARVAVVANKVRDEEDGERVAQRTGLPLVGSIPLDPAAAAADRAGRAVIDVDPGGITATAVRSMLSTLLDEAERH